MGGGPGQAVGWHPEEMAPVGTWAFSPVILTHPKKLEAHGAARAPATDRSGRGCFLMELVKAGNESPAKREVTLVYDIGRHITSNNGH